MGRHKGDDLTLKISFYKYLEIELFIETVVVHLGTCLTFLSLFEGFL